MLVRDDVFFDHGTIIYIYYIYLHLLFIVLADQQLCSYDNNVNKKTY